MTAVVVGVFIHPNGCPVCTDGQVQVCRPGMWVGPVEPCPQCQDGQRVRELVAERPTPSGDAA